MTKLNQIARKAGVSPNTVLRVLRGENKEVWPSALKRADEIRELARQMAYLPNASARSMRRGRFNCVSLVLSTDQGRSNLPDDLFNSIHDAVAERGMRLIVAKLPDAQLTSEERLPSILREMACDGLLINYTDHQPQAMGEMILRYRIPSVWINSRQAADCVYYDDEAGAAAGVRHLAALGHRRIAYLDFVPPMPAESTHYSRIDRAKGYARAMREAGLEAIPPERFGGVAGADRLAATVKLLQSPNRPTALIGYDSGERLLYAAALAGLRVPEDVSLLIFGSKHAPTGANATGENYIGRSIGVIRLPVEKAGAQAVEMLDKKIASPETRLRAQVVPLEVEPGDTCGPASEEAR